MHGTNALNSQWTFEREKMLTALVDEPYTCRWIADEINRLCRTSFTRNSIISKIHRVGLQKATPKNVNRQNKPKCKADATVCLDACVEFFHEKRTIQ